MGGGVKIFLEKLEGEERREEGTGKVFSDIKKCIDSSCNHGIQAFVSASVALNFCAVNQSGKVVLTRIFTYVKANFSRQLALNDNNI